jgi:hypothetical protein
MNSGQQNWKTKFLTHFFLFILSGQQFLYFFVPANPVETCIIYPITQSLMLASTKKTQKAYTLQLACNQLMDGGGIIKQTVDNGKCHSRDT